MIVTFYLVALFGFRDVCLGVMVVYLSFVVCSYVGLLIDCLCTSVDLLVDLR